MPVVLILMLMLLNAATSIHASADPEVDDLPFRLVRKVILALEGMQAAEVAPAIVPQLPHLVQQEGDAKIPVKSPEAPNVHPKPDPAPAWSEADESEWNKHLQGK